MDTYPDLGAMPAIAALWSFRMPPALGIPILTSLTPHDVEWHVQDQNLEPIIFDDDSDLIAISFFTPQAGYAYELGDEFIKRGKTVVMGGMHPSMLPEETSLHCTSVCIGEADTIWPNIIRDFQRQGLQPRYKASSYPAPHEVRKPKQKVFDERRYDWHASLVSLTRGCPYKCSWCNIPHYQGAEIRFRPIDIVVDEIRELSKKEFYITDDVITWNRETISQYMVDLCRRIKTFNVSMFLSGSPAMNSDKKFLNAISEAGCKNMYVVFASDGYSKLFYQKNKAIWSKCSDLVKSLEDRGIRFFGSFSVGYDFAGEEQFDLILEFCRQAKVKTAEFFIATPFPSTPFWHQLQTEDRIHTPVNWKKYNGAHVVFRPKLITEDKLIRGFLSLWKDFYTDADFNSYLVSFPSLHNKAADILSSRREPG